MQETATPDTVAARLPPSAARAALRPSEKLSERQNSSLPAKKAECVNPKLARRGM